MAAVSFPFPGREIEQAGERWEGGERQGGREEVGSKRNRLQSIPNILPNSVRPRTGSNSAI